MQPHKCPLQGTTPLHNFTPTGRATYTTPKAGKQHGSTIKDTAASSAANTGPDPELGSAPPMGTGTRQPLLRLAGKGSTVLHSLDVPSKPPPLSPLRSLSWATGKVLPGWCPLHG